MDYEHLPGDLPLDETDVSLRAYLASLSDDHLAEYDPTWTDEQVTAWDGNFRSDGALMLVCCERDIDVAEFRRALEEHLRFRRPHEQVGRIKKSVIGTALAFLIVLHQVATILQAAEIDTWPQFRGSGALGTSENSQLPDRWSATENVAWKTEIPGLGWSSPVVWGDRLFVTTVVNLGATETPRKGLYFGGNRTTPPTSEHLWKVYCLNLTSGKVLWEQVAHRGVPEGARHLKNSFASETPVTDGERLFVYFGNVGLFCYDLNGKPIWSRPVPPRKMRFGWGTAASPVLHHDRLYLVNDNDEESYLAAFDTRSGNEVWRVARDEKSNWATPCIWRNEQRTELVVPGTGKVRSYDLEGKLLWEFGGMSSITIATPYAQQGLLYVSSGYVLDSLRPVYAIRPGAVGDISLSADQNSNDYIAWRQPTAGPYNPSTLVYGGKLYVLLDRGFFACYDAATGSAVYERQRLPNGSGFTASPWAYGDKVFCLNEDGQTCVIAAGDQFKLLHTNPLSEDDMCMATPALAGDKLLIRTSARIYCLRKVAGS